MPKKLSQIARPAFTAYGAQNISTPGTQTWRSEALDTGGNFNPATGKFTAPVAGLYSFAATGLGEPANQQAINECFRWRVNGVDQTSGRSNFSGATHAHVSITSQIVVRLAAGDVVEIYLPGPTTLYGDTNDGLSTFVGFLIG
ncbi:C1q-like domain-containing protein [Methylorubrum aminovorans]